MLVIAQLHLCFVCVTSDQNKERLKKTVGLKYPMSSSRHYKLSHFHNVKNLKKDYMFGYFQISKKKDTILILNLK